MGCYQILTVGMHNLQLHLSLNKLVVMGFNGMLPDPHYRYSGPTSTPVVNYTGTWASMGCYQILTVGIKDLQVDLILIILPHRLELPCLYLTNGDFCL